MKHPISVSTKPAAGHWSFRNRGSQPVTITLRTSGAYTEIKKVQ
jgi:hypothetical protein